MWNDPDLPRVIRTGLRTGRLLGQSPYARLILVLSAFAWLVILLPETSGEWIDVCLGRGGTSRIYLDLSGSDPPIGQHAALMSLAMMAPISLIYQASIEGRFTSLWRLPARIAFLLPYLALWSLFAIIVSHLRLMFMALGADPVWLLVGVTLLAMIWQGTEFKRRIDGHHHRIFPVPAAGLPALEAMVRRGFAKGALCLASCGPMMLIAIHAGHQAGIMLLITLLALIDRTSYRPRTPALQSGLALAGLSGWIVLTQ